MDFKSFITLIFGKNLGLIFPWILSCISTLSPKLSFVDTQDIYLWLFMLIFKTFDN